MIDFARHCANLDGAHTTEVDEHAPHPVIALITEWTDFSGRVERRSQSGDLGGTMRLGEQACVLNQGSLAERVYGSGVVHERHRHRYEVNIHYVEQLIQSGLVVGGRSEDGELVEMIELEDHPWFWRASSTQNSPVMPRRGHPLFTGFIEAGLAYAGVAENQ